MKPKIFFIVISTLMLSCYPKSYFKTDDTVQKYEETDSRKIEIYVTDKVDRAYVILGEVSCFSPALGRIYSKKSSVIRADGVINLLKNNASKLGADAIINVRLSYTEGFHDWTKITSTGTAIKFLN
jgi:hypothetical protein